MFKVYLMIEKRKEMCPVFIFDSEKDALKFVTLCVTQRHKFLFEYDIMDILIKGETS